MKKLVAVLLVLLASGANAVSIRGPVSCGAWVKERQEAGWGTQTNQAWLVGYLSGVAAASDKDFIKGTDNPSIFLYLDNFCRANPLKTIDEAADALTIELIKQKKL
ncbi:hypothetical protein [Variovorax fucosicus]|uniref:hypothetical protein n=1 Tax=Variovorax fucosicus TaxID=3053517 RepID=UPI002576BDAD|nr:hypothetical protein [Variovorax sp. J22G47]MDM0057346.1 hypothetical protein [Variovorax sp. J22G47]